MIRWILGILSILMLGFVIYKVSTGDAHIQRTLQTKPAASVVDTAAAVLDTTEIKK